MVASAQPMPEVVLSARASSEIRSVPNAAAAISTRAFMKPSPVQPAETTPLEALLKNLTYSVRQVSTAFDRLLRHWFTWATEKHKSNVWVPLQSGMRPHAEASGHQAVVMLVIN